MVQVIAQIQVDWLLKTQVWIPLGDVYPSQQWILHTEPTRIKPKLLPGHSPQQVPNLGRGTHWQSPQTNMDTCPKSEPALELISMAAPSVEAHHRSVVPDAGKNSRVKRITKKFTFSKYYFAFAKNTIFVSFRFFCPFSQHYQQVIACISVELLSRQEQYFCILQCSTLIQSLQKTSVF